MNTKRFEPIVILTGAGISAESGLRTFRDQNGLWEEHRLEDVASMDGFRRDRGLVNRFYNVRRKQLLDPNVKPNAAHIALSRLEEEWEGPFLLVTQNVDNLHSRAGSKRIVHMHGELTKVRCESCENVVVWEQDLENDTLCTKCRAPQVRPHIVWFGEMPFAMELIDDALGSCRIFVAIGTSGQVYPAAGFVSYAHNAEKIEVNLQTSEISSRFDRHLLGPATEMVPRLVDELLKR